MIYQCKLLDFSANEQLEKLFKSSLPRTYILTKNFKFTRKIRKTWDPLWANGKCPPSERRFVSDEENAKKNNYRDDAGRRSTDNQAHAQLLGC